MLNDINGLVICGFIVIFIFILSMVLRSGRGAFLISGYNILPKNKKALFNEKALCQLYGNLLLIVDAILIIAIIAAIFEITWIIILLTVLLILISFGATIYAYTDQRFRN